jgi:hypothetical protein
MQHRPAVTMAQTIDDLLEDVLSFILSKSLLSLYIMQKVSSSCVLHHDEEVLGTFEYFKQSDDVRMMDLLQDVYFLKHFLSTEVIFHVRLFKCFDGHLFPTEFVNSKCHFSKSTFPYEFDEFVKVESCGRKTIVLFNVGSKVLN